MATYDANLQAAVDATSIAKSMRETDDLVEFLREQLHERDIETKDEAWLKHTVEKIHEDTNYMIDSEPSDYERPEPQLPR
ncbi:hypothetical protein NSZ01_28970 [Nocardioides szechwanensis]|uniref:Uncharacterized protein n=1 Tax=Nocardioides szechwanensis TaxID=1005944 RepID=A0A1H0JI42_9ACTN|nr:hypothetical protein [Nocardioides szechwanensis]GEP35129.1 hypothetical protein NSZ01_28970 [Nocardioides szechwanensis]SDO43314.1 hypothetical protein SAMN05192576_4029 [Nocardioides szechwanensis]